MENRSTADTREPIALIGAACRLPGAEDVSAFWNLLIEERDTVTEIPTDRFDIDRWFDPTPGKRHRISSRAGGFINGVDAFDAAFFGFSPHVAMRLDPQQRLLMESSWEAIEDAGIPAEELSGSRTGVYASCPGVDYWDLLRQAGMYDLHAGISGTTSAFAAGLISYHLDLRGPSIGLETTCSSSLLSIHLACRALQNGDIDQAIVGASNLLLTADKYFSLSEAELLSPSGRCKFGDANADGFVRSEAVASVVLKPLSRAIADGNPIYACIVGSGTSHDGRTGGTAIAAGREGQREMLRAAYRDAGISPGDLDYVEAHGAGTPMGDIAELSALSDILREGRPTDRRCLVGSVKTNVGHSEFAAGLIGLLKVALAIRHRTIPATLHVSRPSAILTEPDSPIELATRTQPWPRQGERMLAGVSAFGLSGTNTHIVLGEPAVPDTDTRPRSRTSEHHMAGYLLPLSAHDSGALTALAARYADQLSTGVTSINVRDVCFSAGVHRTHHKHRLAVLGTDRSSLVTGLRSAGSTAPAATVITGQPSGDEPPHVVFVFSGQGAQWVGMGRELLATSPVFAEKLRECDAAIREECGWSVIERLIGDEPPRSQSEIQPTIWAMQVALAAVWRDWGIQPDTVIGHSVGEIAAAVTSGALTVGQGAAVVCRRSVLLTELPVRGAMWAVQLGEQQAWQAIGEHADKVCVAVVNSEHSTVLSGDAATLTRVLEPVRSQGVFCRPVRVDYASHSYQMDVLRTDLLSALADLTPRQGDVPIQSTVLDRSIDGSQMDAAYWMANLREPVRFASAVSTILEQHPNTVFIEINSHPLLVSAIEDGIEAAGADAAAIPSLHREQPEFMAMLASLGTAYVRGLRPDWHRLYPDGRYVSLPGYPWQRKSYWATDGADATDDTTDTVIQAEAELAFLSATECAEYLAHRVAEVLAMPTKDIDPTVPLPTLGLDSLLAVRVRTRVKDDLGVLVPIRDLLGGHTVQDVARNLYARIRNVEEEYPPGDEVSVAETPKLGLGALMSVSLSQEP